MRPGRPCRGLLLPLGTGAPKGLVCGGEEPALTLPGAMAQGALRVSCLEDGGPPGLEDAGRCYVVRESQSSAVGKSGKLLPPRWAPGAACRASRIVSLLTKSLNVFIFNLSPNQGLGAWRT